VTRTQRMTMGLVGVLVAHLLLVLVAEAQVLVEAYFCQDGLYMQPVLAPSLGSTLDKYDTSPGMVLASRGTVLPGTPSPYLTTACTQPLPYPFLVQPPPPPRRSAEDPGGVTPPLEPLQ
jgi:hypothetical protein